MNSFIQIRSLVAVLFMYFGGTVPAFAFCFISIEDVLFGDYDAAEATPQITTAAYQLQCRHSVVLTLEISSSGTSVGGEYRQMHHTGGRDTLAYNLFSDSTMTRIWGDGRRYPAPAVRVNGRHDGLIYGKVLAAQNVWPGKYEDALRLSILP